MNRNERARLTDEIIAGTRRITAAEALAILQTPDADIMGLFADADRLRQHFRGSKIHLCAIENVKSGRCSEDCGFCAQSAHFKTGVEEYGLVNDAQVEKARQRAERDGASALGLVAAWKGLDEGPTLDAICQRIEKLAQSGGPRADASLGIIPKPQIAERLKKAGLVCYNHNLETAPSYFDKICTTHTFEDRLQTLKYCRDAGIKLCSGGIVGMGETLEQRVELAFALADVEPDMVPLNFLNPIHGTELVDTGRAQKLEPLECLKTIAMFRFVMPKANIMVAGGREVNLGELQSLMFNAGASATMVGSYLTTAGRDAQTDLRLIESLGLTPDGEL